MRISICGYKKVHSHRSTWLSRRKCRGVTPCESVFARRVTSSRVKKQRELAESQQDTQQGRARRQASESPIRRASARGPSRRELTRAGVHQPAIRRRIRDLQEATSTWLGLR